MYVFKVSAIRYRYFKKCNVSFKDERNHTSGLYFSYCSKSNRERIYFGNDVITPDYLLRCCSNLL